MDKYESPIKVGIVPLDGFALMSYASTVEPLRAANDLSGQVLYDVQTIRVGEHSVKSSFGDFAPSQIEIDETNSFDLIFVIAGGNSLDVEHTLLANWLRGQARRGVQIGGVSAAPLFLAKNGLLDGRRMTVHWEHAEYLKEVIPDALFEPSLYVIDRDRLTCGGGTAPIDLMLALISNQHGQSLARQVGDWFLHTTIRPSVGPQRANLTARYGTVNAAVLSAIEAIETHVANPLSLEELSKIAGTSGRQLTRLFLENVAQTPIQFGRKLRLSKAKTLLQTTSLSVSEIAMMTGFSSPAHLSNCYLKEFRTTPSKARYKTKFSSPSPTSK